MISCSATSGVRRRRRRGSTSLGTSTATRRSLRAAARRLAAPPPWCNGQHASPFTLVSASSTLAGGIRPRSSRRAAPAATVAARSLRDGPPGTRTQNHGINLPHRLSPATRRRAARACGLDHLFTLGRPVRVGGVWPLRALPHARGCLLIAQSPGIVTGLSPVPRALRGFQQIAADELAVSRASAPSQKSLALPIELTARTPRGV